jgi:Lrp/AsnC family leucine-responsive transcriptional regulator
VDPKRAGYGISAFLRITVAGGESIARRLAAALPEIPEVRECHRATGDEAFILRVDAESVTTLEQLIDRLTEYGMTSTSIILSSPIRQSILMRPHEGRRKKGVR